MTDRRGWRWPAPRITRDGILFVGGLIGVAHEMLFSTVERPSLLIVFAGMMGLPVFLRRDDSEQEPK